MDIDSVDQPKPPPDKELLSEDEKRIARNISLANKLIDTFLDEEDAKIFREGKLGRNFFEVVFKSPNKSLRDEISFQFIGDINSYNSTSQEPFPPVVQGPIIKVLPGDEDPSIIHHTRYGDLPQIFVDSSGDKFVLMQFYYVSPGGQAFVSQYLDRIGEWDEDTPRFDITIETDFDWIGTRNFDEQDYAAVNRAIELSTSQEYKEVPLDEQGREIEEPL